jgi:probable rRNA maturation factor
MLHGKLASDAAENRFELSLANEQSAHAIDSRRLMRAARRVLVDSKFTSATVSLAVVDDPTIHGLNRQFLHHDWPTDVLSFVLEDDGARLKGEVVLSADTASMVAHAGGWKAADEQLLYVIHGVLHLLGLDDQTEADARRMRAAERYYLHEFGVVLPEDSLPEDPLSEDQLPEDAESIATTDDPPGRGGTQAW